MLVSSTFEQVWTDSVKNMEKKHVFYKKKKHLYISTQTLA